ncbi:cell adhesion molecule 2-like [Anneissia japonica]|uniref:cell adhesion molecule 2-like n=1 Tax=Anneissia japonica TaxID=1529436 RepID=UPI0014257F21|nr:cell adhesion molecule 2-like [Anneissia japonica]
MASKIQLQLLIITCCFYQFCSQQNVDITIVFHTKHIQAHQHGNVELLCTLHGDLNNEMEFSWLKDGAQFIPDYNDHQRSDISAGNVVLDISDVKLSDEGHYQCVVKYREKVIAISRPGYLTVQGIPDKNYPQCFLSKHLYTEGDKVNISCISETKGNFKMQWLKPPQDTEMIQSEKTDFTKLFCSFEATKQQHGKEYKCLMKMEGEQVPRVCSTKALNITNQLHVYTTTPEFIYTGKSLNITCDTKEHFEDVSYTWIFENCSSDMSNKFINMNEKIYINTIDMDMNGCHVTCKAAKNMATGNYTYVMKVIQNDQEINVSSLSVQALKDESEISTIVLTTSSCFIFIIVAIALLIKYKKKNTGTLDIPGILTPQGIRSMNRKPKGESV